MKSNIEAAIKILADKITTDVTVEEALKFSQGALNLAHTLSTIDGNIRENAKNTPPNNTALADCFGCSGDEGKFENSMETRNTNNS